MSYQVHHNHNGYSHRYCHGVPSLSRPCFYPGCSYGKGFANRAENLSFHQRLCNREPEYDSLHEYGSKPYIYYGIELDNRRNEHPYLGSIRYPPSSGLVESNYCKPDPYIRDYQYVHKAVPYFEKRCCNRNYNHSYSYRPSMPMYSGTPEHLGSYHDNYFIRPGFSQESTSNNNGNTLLNLPRVSPEYQNFLNIDNSRYVNNINNDSLAAQGRLNINLQQGQLDNNENNYSTIDDDLRRYDVPLYRIFYNTGAVYSEQHARDVDIYTPDERHVQDHSNSVATENLENCTTNESGNILAGNNSEFHNYRNIPDDKDFESNNSASERFPVQSRDELVTYLLNNDERTSSNLLFTEINSSKCDQNIRHQIVENAALSSDQGYSTDHSFKSLRTTNSTNEISDESKPPTPLYVDAHDYVKDDFIKSDSVVSEIKSNAIERSHREKHTSDSSQIYNNTYEYIFPVSSPPKNIALENETSHSNLDNDHLLSIFSSDYYDESLWMPSSYKTSNINFDFTCAPINSLSFNSELISKNEDSNNHSLHNATIASHVIGNSQETFNEVKLEVDKENNVVTFESLIKSWTSLSPLLAAECENEKECTSTKSIKSENEHFSSKKQCDLRNLDFNDVQCATVSNLTSDNLIPMEIHAKETGIESNILKFFDDCELYDESKYFNQHPVDYEINTGSGPEIENVYTKMEEDVLVSAELINKQLLSKPVVLLNRNEVEKVIDKTQNKCSGAHKRDPCLYCGEDFDVYCQILQNATKNIEKIDLTSKKNSNEEICLKQSSNDSIHRRTNGDENFNSPRKKQIKTKNSTTEPFKCNVCSASFSKQKTLISHAILHTAVGPHTCPICGYRCLSNLDEQEHLKKHNKEVRSDPLDVLEYILNCQSICDVPKDLCPPSNTAEDFSKFPSSSINDKESIIVATAPLLESKPLIIDENPQNESTNKEDSYFHKKFSLKRKLSES